eukprot:TRINITY_DN49774_c0_g1_i1.p1 TRINITY_DN49774_c0_g1~~TRINITY_DN49774_c0_g1_i1.p1  ORF type:complete len:383 (-),score=89.01 TRINITY_DN49774_c0_g1_i1:22-1086(-)
MSSAFTALRCRANARRFWRVAKKGFPIVQPVPYEPAALRNAYSSDFLFTLTTDEVRMKAFRKAIESFSAKRVLEVGCGPWTPLIEMALESGASKVVAVEASPSHAASASSRLAKPISEDKVKVVQGMLSELGDEALRPDASFEPDLLVAELLGYTASEEGAPAVFADLQRRFGPLPAIPARAQSFAVPVGPLSLSWADVWRNWWVHGGRPSKRKLAPGQLYDCRNFPKGLHLDSPQIWEEFNFSNLQELEAQLQQKRTLTFKVPSGTEVSGLLVWMRTEISQDNFIDTLQDYTSWNQYYIYTGIQRVGEDGELRVVASVDARTDDVSYEFNIGAKTWRSHPKPAIEDMTEDKQG